jgi:hypothetical protein
MLCTRCLTVDALSRCPSSDEVMKVFKVAYEINMGDILDAANATTPENAAYGTEHFVGDSQ